MTMLAHLHEEGVLRTKLSDDKSEVEFIDGDDGFYRTTLDKRDMDELIGDLTDLRDKMLYKDDSE